jgi:penicillin-binding protein 2
LSVKFPKQGPRQASPDGLFWAQVFIGVAFLVLIGRLWYLQVSSGEHYFRKSLDNNVKERELPAPRGVIRADNGALLADNRPSYQVSITPRAFTDEALQELARILRLDDEAVDTLKAKVLSVRGAERSRGMMAIDDISRDEMSVIDSDALNLPGVQVLVGTRRAYPYGTLAGHSIGYLGQVTPEEVGSPSSYHIGDALGRAGLEKQWESFLRGTDGMERIVVDVKGRRRPEAETPEVLGGPQRVEPLAGLDVVTTLDLPLQAAVEKTLKRWHSAAAVVLDVETGRVLAMASQPAIDPGKLTGRISHAEMQALLKDETHPLLDKTEAGSYFPGSTFKVVPMLAAIADNAVDPDEHVVCHGGIRYGSRWFHCVEPHGPVNLQSALSKSCNVYFYGIGEKVGLDRMAEVAEDLGLGAPTGLGLNSELAGFIPTTEWYKKQGTFQKGVSLITAIGQESVKVTLVQLATAYAAIANGGRLYVPQIVSRLQRGNGEIVQEFPPRLRRELKASPQALKLVRSALVDAVNDPKGTAFAVRLDGVKIAGKTGTAQVGDHRNKGEATQSLSDDHGWFASFGPAEKPEIAVVALVEHGGFGAKSAAPVVMDIYRAWFQLHHNRTVSYAAKQK